VLDVKPDSWTRRLDDRVLGRRGVLIVLALAALSFGLAAIFSAIEASWVSAVIYGALAVFAGQATLVQGRQRRAR
jgi:uncharacterized membrane protein HdeD (DUF308 family)